MGPHFVVFSLSAVQTLKPTSLQLGTWSRSRFSSPVGLCVARPSHSHRSLLSLCLQWCCRELSCVPSGSRAAPVSGRFSVPCPGSGPSDFSCLPSSCWESFMVPPHTFFLPFPRSLYSVYWPLYVSPCGLRTPRSAAPPRGQWAFKDFYVPFPCSP